MPIQLKGKLALVVRSLTWLQDTHSQCGISTHTAQKANHIAHNRQGTEIAQPKDSERLSVNPLGAAWRPTP